MAETLETRTTTLEDALMKLVYAQFNSEMQFQDLKKELSAWRERSEMEMAEFKSEMSAFKDEMRVFREETRAESRAMNRRWGEISNKLGTIVEDIVYSNMERIAREVFGATDVEFEGLRLKRSHARERGRLREFDVIVSWPGHVLLTETKATIRPEYLADFVAFVAEQRLFEFFPEYADRRLIPVFASLYVPESDVAYLTAQRIYVLGMGENNMELLNLAALGLPGA